MYEVVYRTVHDRHRRQEEPDVDEEAMEEAGNLGAPFTEPDHGGEEWEEWVDWSAPERWARDVARRAGGGGPGGPGRCGAARAGDMHVPLDTAVYSKGTGVLRRAFTRDGLNVMSALTCIALAHRCLEYYVSPCLEVLLWIRHTAGKTVRAARRTVHTRVQTVPTVPHDRGQCVSVCVCACVCVTVCVGGGVCV